MPFATGLPTREGVLKAETSQKTCPCIIMNLKLSRKELGTEHKRDAAKKHFSAIRYIFVSLSGKENQVKKSFLLKVNSAKVYL